MEVATEVARARLVPLLEHNEPRLTRLSASRYGLRVKRPTGRWDRTPFSGTPRKMVQLHPFMQYLVATW